MTSKPIGSYNITTTKDGKTRIIKVVRKTNRPAQYAAKIKVKIIRGSR